MAKPRRIILVRHGQSQANEDKTFREHTPDHRILLTDKGAEQARVAGAEIKDLLGKEQIRAYISPYARTRQTYENILSGGNLNVTRVSEDPRLREQDFGNLNSLEAFEKIDAERTHFGTFFYRIPNGESGADVFDRVSGFMDSLWRDFEKPDFPNNVLIVSHGLTLRLFCMRWFKWSVEDFEKLRNPWNCEKYILELEYQNGFYPTGKYKLTTPFREYTPEETQQWKESKVTTVMGGNKPWMQ